MRPNGYVSMVWVVILAAAVSGCGSSSSSNAPKPTGLSKRVLLTNQDASTVNLLDANKDVLTSKVFAAPGGSKIITAGGQTVVMDATQTDLTVIDNATEVVTFTMVLDDQPVDIAITTDGVTAFAAERNLGEVRFGTTSNGAVSPAILHVPAARRLVMSPNGTKLLVFSDPQTQTNITTIFVIDTASKGIVAITSPSFDQPITAVFGSGETQAFILNCGAECGGTAASVVSVDFSGVFNASPTPATIGAPIPVAAATVGLLNGTNLFVAGTPPTAPAGLACPLSHCGTLQIVNTGNSTAGPPIAITDGFHQKMAFTVNSLYIGAAACTVDPGSAPNTVRGCLSIFNTATRGTTFPEESSFRQNFDVTGFQPISGRSVMYVIQGGELDFFNTATATLATNITEVDIVGKAVDVVQIDP